MGKKRIQRLLTQLEDHHQQGSQNSAAIYTVAQVAIDRLEQSLDLLADTTSPQAIAAGSEDFESAAQPIAPTGLNPVLTLPPSSQIDKVELKRRYGSLAACRKAAKEMGISFAKTPSWDRLVAAWQFQEGLLHLRSQYLQACPMTDLESVTISLKF